MQFLSILVSLAIATSLGTAQPQNGQLEECQTKCPGSVGCPLGGGPCRCPNGESCRLDEVPKPPQSQLEDCETKCPGEAYDCQRAGGDNNVCRCSNKERCLQVSKAPPPLEDCQTKCPGEQVCDLSTGNICECPNNGQCLGVDKPDLSRLERCETKCPGEASGCQRVGGDNVCRCSNKERCLQVSIPEPPQCPSTDDSGKCNIDDTPAQFDPRIGRIVTQREGMMPLCKLAVDSKNFCLRNGAVVRWVPSAGYWKYIHEGPRLKVPY